MPDASLTPLLTEARALEGGPQPHDAVWVYERAVTLCRSRGDHEIAAHILDHLASLCGRVGRFADARDNSEEVLEIAAEIALDIDVTSIRRRLSRAHFALGDVSQAVATLEAAFTDAPASRHGALHADLAYILLESDQIEAAIRHLKVAVAQCRGANDLGHAAWASSELGHIEKRGRRFADAIGYYNRAAALARQYGDAASALAASRHVAETYREQGDLQAAIETCESALEFAREVGISESEMLILNDLGNAYADLDRHTDAVQCLDRAATLARTLGDAKTEATILVNRSTPLSRLRRDAEALQSCQDAAVLFEGVGHFDATSALIESGVLLHQRRRYREADAAVDNALSIARELRGRPGEALVLERAGTEYAQAGGTERALGYYRKAIALYRSEGDSAAVRRLLNASGVIQADAFPHDALECYSEALTVPDGGADALGVAAVEHNTADLLLTMRRYKDALQHAERALALFAESGEKADEARELCLLGGITALLGRSREANQYFAKEVAARRKLGDPSALAVALGNYGHTSHQLGEVASAKDGYEEALAILRQLGDAAGEAKMLSEFAVVHEWIGDYDEALTCMTRALDRYHSVRGLSGEMSAHHTMGRLYHRLGQSDRALMHLEHARTLLADFHRPDPGAEATLLVDTALAHRSLGRSVVALECAERALALFREVGDRYHEAPALDAVAVLRGELGKASLDDQLAIYHESLAIRREVGDPIGEAATLNNLSAIYREKGEDREAVACAEEALSLHRSIGNKEGQLSACHRLALIFDALGDVALVRKYYEEALALAERIRGTLPGDELRSSYFAEQQNMFRHYVAFLVAKGDVAAAFHVAERSRARTFADLLGEARAGIRQGANPRLLSEEHKLLHEIQTLTERLARELPDVGESERTPDVKARLKVELRHREQALDALNAQIKLQSPQYAALMQPQVLTVAEVPLDDDTVLLEYVLAEPESFVFVVSREVVRVVRLPSGQEIERRVWELREALDENAHRYPHGYWLYRTLVQPAADLIRDRDLLVVADGALHYLPFGLLLTEPPDGDEALDGVVVGESEASSIRGAGRTDDRLPPVGDRLLGAPFDWGCLPYLVRERAIGYAPSATVAGMVAQAAREKPRHYEGVLAALACPLDELTTPHADGHDGGPVELAAARSRAGVELGPIPHTVDEVTEVMQVLAPQLDTEACRERLDTAGVWIRLRSGATRTAVRELDGRAFRFVHLACHGVVDAGKPQLSGLVLTPTGEGDRDYYWRAFEVFNMRLPAELVVLSACETGLGRLVHGEGLVGLVRAFLYAGAQALCVSLWRVDDASTPGLMRQLYQHIADGHRKPRALQRAQLAMIDSGDSANAHPLAWAPFTMIAPHEYGGLDLDVASPASQP